MDKFVIKIAILNSTELHPAKETSSKLVLKLICNANHAQVPKLPSRAALS